MGFNKRQGKQCRERWINFLSPDIKRDQWTPQEDLLLLTKQQSIGNQWALIAKDILGRTENQVKNRFNSLIKKIREEKTFSDGLKKGGIHEALGDLNHTASEAQSRKVEIEDQWIKELILRKREEIERVEELKEGMVTSTSGTVKQASFPP